MRTTLFVLVAALCVGAGSSALFGDITQVFKAGNDRCSACKNFLRDVAVSMRMKGTKREGIGYVDAVFCKELPTAGEEICRVLVQGLMPQFFDKGAAYLDSKIEVICSDVTFCSDTFEQEFEEIVEDVKKYLEKIIKKHHHAKV